MMRHKKNNMHTIAQRASISGQAVTTEKGQHSTSGDTIAYTATHAITTLANSMLRNAYNYLQI